MHCQTFFSPVKEVGQSSKEMTCYAQIPNCIILGQMMYEKSVTKFFTPFSILALLGDLLGQNSPILVLIYSKAPCINLPNFVCSGNPRYLGLPEQIR